jgi:hypothetical protein
VKRFRVASLPTSRRWCSSEPDRDGR